MSVLLGPFNHYRLTPYPWWLRLLLRLRPMIWVGDPQSSMALGMKQLRGVWYVVCERSA